MRILIQFSLGVIAAALAIVTQAAPLPAKHPLIGTWQLDLLNGSCHEVYQIRSDGTVFITSGQEVAESVIELSENPNANGFYLWSDELVTDNGKPDCMGNITEVGHKASHFILLHPSVNMFLLCSKETMQTCFGPFVRLGGAHI